MELYINRWSYKLRITHESQINGLFPVGPFIVYVIGLAHNEKLKKYIYLKTCN